MSPSAPPPFLITTSWDDGHPSDARIAEMLARYGVQGTFYVPTINCEGRPVMGDGALRTLARGFEIGAHTRDHVVLTTCTPDEAEIQIRSNRDRLQDKLGSRIDGFAYVRGQHDRVTRAIVERLGFDYARTTVNFACAPWPDRFRVPTTLQCFPHTLGTRLRNLVRRGVTRDRLAIMAHASRGVSLSRAIQDAALAAQARGRFFHLWGHAWELDEFGLWRDLEKALRMLSDMNARHVTNGALVRELRGQDVLNPVVQVV